MFSQPTIGRQRPPHADARLRNRRRERTSYRLRTTVVVNTTVLSTPVAVTGGVALSSRLEVERELVERTEDYNNRSLILLLLPTRRLHVSSPVMPDSNPPNEVQKRYRLSPIGSMRSGWLLGGRRRRARRGATRSPVPLHSHLRQPVKPTTRRKQRHASVLDPSMSREARLRDDPYHHRRRNAPPGEDPDEHERLDQTPRVERKRTKCPLDAATKTERGRARAGLVEHRTTLPGVAGCDDRPRQAVPQEPPAHDDVGSNDLRAEADPLARSQADPTDWEDERAVAGQTGTIASLASVPKSPPSASILERLVTRARRKLARAVDGRVLVSRAPVDLDP